MYDNSDAIVNVWNVQINSGAPMAFAAAAQDFAEYVEALYRPIVASYPTRLVSDRISVKNETQSTVWGAIAWEVLFQGTNVGDPAPTQTCLLGWARTPISRVQIRKYFGPFTEVEMSLGFWNAPVRAECQGTMDYHIVPNAMTNGLILQGVAYSVLLARATLALTATTAETPVVQRRRRRGRGG